MGRSILGFLAGAAVAMVIIAAVEGISNIMHPLPEGLDTTDMEAMRAHAKTLPSSAFVMVLLAWSLGALGGGWLAAKIARRSPGTHGLAVGLLLLLGAVINLLLIPHPGWMWPAGVLLPPALGYLGGLLARRSAPLSSPPGAAVAQG